MEIKPPPLLPDGEFVQEPEEKEPIFTPLRANIAIFASGIFLILVSLFVILSAKEAKSFDQFYLALITGMYTGVWGSLVTERGVLRLWPYIEEYVRKSRG